MKDIISWKNELSLIQLISYTLLNVSPYKLNKECQKSSLQISRRSNNNTKLE